jgi:uncharacterized membrane protein
MDWFWKDWPVQGSRDIVTGTLMAVSGMSCSLSSSNLRRGIKTLSIAVLLSAVTFIFMPSETIVFGVLHYFGVCMILWALLGRYIGRIPAKSGVAVSALLFVLLRFLPQRVLLIPFVGQIPLPAWLYSSPFLFWMGFPRPEFFSADYYPILPWGLLFLAGGILGAHWKRAGFPRWLYSGRMPFVAYLGRHTLIIYLIHQPIFIGLLWLAFNLWR